MQFYYPYHPKRLEFENSRLKLIKNEFHSRRSHLYDSVISLETSRPGVEVERNYFIKSIKVDK